jgi:alkylated DNA repair dioxygenase AlkB
MRTWHYDGMAKAKGNLSFFENPPQVPDGFIYQPDFISEDEEQALVREIQNIDLKPFKYYQFTGRRRTTSFGWEYEFGKSEIIAAAGIPEFLLPLRERAGTLYGIDSENLVQSSIIEYSTGAPIGWHRDIPHFGVVIGISLGAACRMRFRQYPSGRAKNAKRDAILSIVLQRRSIYLMSGPSRETWQHSIPPVKELRYAIMMRTLRDSGTPRRWGFGGRQYWEKKA